MTKSAAEILREYGPFPGVNHVHGVSFDGQHVWFAAGDKLSAFDPASGKMSRSLDVAAHAGTAFDGQHLFQIHEDRIQKVDPKSGRVLTTIPAPGILGDSGAQAWAEERHCGSGSIGPARSIRSIPRPAPSSALSDQPLRHRRHLGRRRTLARHLGR